MVDVLSLDPVVVASEVEEAVEEESVAEAVDEPVFVLLALEVVMVAAVAEGALAVVVELEAVPEDEEDVAVAAADELEDEEVVLPSVMLNWFCMGESC